MFDRLTIRGSAASILWGYRPAATLTAWRIAKVKGQWMLTGTLARSDAFQLRQTPLLFTAPHEGGRDGWWAWGINSIQVGPRSLVAHLGPPEQ